MRKPSSWCIRRCTRSVVRGVVPRVDNVAGGRDDCMEERFGFGLALKEQAVVDPFPRPTCSVNSGGCCSPDGHAVRGIVAPRDVSLVVADDDPSFAWCNTDPSRIRWDYRPVVRRVVRWAKNVATGKDDLRKIGTESKFIEGGTIGPAMGR